jgi:hypothetical protein
MKSAYKLTEYGDGYITLVDLNPGELPEKIKVGKDTLLRKEEFHISLVWIGRLSEMVDKRKKKKIKEEMIKEFEKFTKEHSLEDYILTKELRLVKQGGQKTVIVMANMPNIDLFFENLSRKYGVNLPVQPTHITLYTSPSDRIGIGILSYGELSAISEPIDIPELRELL